jgi:RNA polymerase-interacting CarD/CdnL/TRCF family regulator
VIQGGPRDVVVLELAEALFVTLPVALARTSLRPLLSREDLQRVKEALRKDPTPSEGVWLKRRKEAQVKISDGDPLRLAEVVRDGALRERRLIAKGNGSQLSPGERALYRKARSLLSGEISLVNGLGSIDAEAWIDQQLG